MYLAYAAVLASVLSPRPDREVSEVATSVMPALDDQLTIAAVDICAAVV